MHIKNERNKCTLKHCSQDGTHHNVYVALHQGHLATYDILHQWYMYIIIILFSEHHNTCMYTSSQMLNAVYAY